MKYIIVTTYNSNFLKPCGNDTIADIDKSKFSKRKYNRGKHKKGVWVLGIIEKATQNNKLFTVEKRSKETLKKHIQQTIKKRFYCI